MGLQNIGALVLSPFADAAHRMWGWSYTQCRGDDGYHMPMPVLVSMASTFDSSSLAYLCKWTGHVGTHLVTMLSG
jgi:hypothetical protein